ncbi:MAG: T9SS type A sorting domain-containing protein [Terrimonas sp.]|nr:T9SS type A sorting domain-containing protein [Terrimonas sp.]
MKTVCMPDNRTFILLVIIFLGKISFTAAQSEPFSKRVVTSALNSAWEVVYGPGDSLWVTENRTWKVYRVDIASGTKTTVLNLRSGPDADPAINFPTNSGTQPQGGMMGLALHPNLFSTDPAVRAAKPWVYIAYVYNRGSCPGTNTSCIFTTKIVRYDYTASTLSNPVTVLDNIPGSSDHNSGRLVIGPVIESGSDAAHTQYRLYYTVGDMGAGQFLNTTRAEHAQDIDVMEGKVLRLNTEDDTDPGLDAWIPNDNYFYNASTISPQDYVYSYGHRNAQGLAWGHVNGTDILYSSEQMDRTDDEINIIQKGKNYGWDSVSGYCDDNVNGYKIGQNSSANETAFCSTHPEHTPPIFTLFTETAANMAALMAQSNNSFWPTVACSSIDFYGYNVIPGWNPSLLVTPLKKDLVYRVNLTAAGTAVSGDTISYFRGDGNRIRRVTVAPDGLRFYVARDASATSNGGTIMEYTYTGTTLALRDDPVRGPRIVNDLIKIYPNPVNGFLYIHGIRELSKPLRAELYDIMGQMRATVISSRNDFTLDMSSLEKGLYLLKLINGNEQEVQVEKIIRQ